MMSKQSFTPTQRERRLLSLNRAIVAQGRTVFNPTTDAVSIARDTWRDDMLARDFAEQIVRKSAVSLLDSDTTTTFNRKIIDVIAPIMGEASTFYQIIKRAIPVTFGQASSIFVSGVSASSTNISFTAKGSATPVQSYDLSTGVELKAGQQVSTISVFSRETIDSENADVLIEAKMPQDVAKGVEELFFDDVAGTTTRPAGSRNGVAKATATAGGGTAALAADLAVLGGAIAAVGNDIVYAASPKTALRARILAPLCPFPILPSSGIADGVLIAMAPNALVVAGSDEPPKIEVSREATLHLETSPTGLTGNATATPVTAAFPVRSLFQTDCVAVRIKLELTWGWRGAGVSWTDSVSW